MKVRTACFLWTLVLVSLLGAASMGAADPMDEGLALHRSLQFTRLIPGEVAQITLEVENKTKSQLSYTLIEEIPLELDVVRSGTGSFNRMAGFIVWSGTLEGSERHVHTYTATLREHAIGSVPLYAYVSATTGAMAENAAELVPTQVTGGVSLATTLLELGGTTVVQLRVTNPVDRPLLLQLTPQGFDALGLGDAVPSILSLSPSEVWERQFNVTPSEPGSYTLSVSPRLGDAPAGPTTQATLTVYTGERPVPIGPTQNQAQHRDAASGVVSRVHRVKLPQGSVLPGQDLMVIAPLPEGAHYVSGSGLVEMDPPQPVEPVLRSGHLLFPVPGDLDIVLRYLLSYEHAGQIEVGERDDLSIGIVAMGTIPRLLRGDPRLLELFDGGLVHPARYSEGVRIVDPLPGQVFTDRQHVDIEVEAPLGAQISLFVGGQAVPIDRLGMQGTDALGERYGERYIAVPLAVGENELVAIAAMPDGKEYTDRIVVYRSGPPASITISPVTELSTGRVGPIVLQVEAADKHGLPPADGTVMTLDVHGVKVLSEDSHPQWQGHQQVLHGGITFLQIEAPQEAALATIEARLGDVVAREWLQITAQADTWFIMGHGRVRAEGMPQPLGSGVALSSGLRLFARGPVDGDAVLTVAYDSDGLGNIDTNPSLWTGDGSTAGRFGSSTGPYYARVERGLSYIQLGNGAVDFDGALSRYTRSHNGLHYHWADSSKVTLHAFRALEATDAAQDELPGDGTRYYRLSQEYIEPLSEDVTVIVRDRLYPHPVVNERRLSRADYRLDYRTGQLFLQDPLGATDADGNRQILRVRYRTIEADKRDTIYGVQALLHDLPGLARATLLWTHGPTQPERSLVSLGYVGTWHGTEVAAEVASSISEQGIGSALLLKARNKDVGGWNVALMHSSVEAAFAPLQGSAERGVLTTLRGERRLGTSTKLTAGLSHQRRPLQAPASYAGEVGAAWSLGSVRPTVTLKGRWEPDNPFSLAVEGRVGTELQRGMLEIKAEQPLAGTDPSRQSLSGQYRLGSTLAAHLDVAREVRDPSEPPRYQASWGLTNTWTHQSGEVTMKGGYELASKLEGMGQAMVYGIGSKWAVNDAHTLEVGVEHRQPIGHSGSGAMGSTLGWTYETSASDSTFRLDLNTDGAKSKHALQWNGTLKMSEHFGLRGEALWTDDHGGMRTRISLSGAYRTEPLVILGGLTGEQSAGGSDERGSLEARIKAMLQPLGSLTVNGGYAQRRTVAPTVTEKLSLGIAWQLAPQTALLMEHSLLVQRDTRTRYAGSMVGISRQIVQDMWFTLRYGHADYIAFDAYGKNFGRNRSGLFVELDIGFHELSLEHWLRDRQDKHRGIGPATL